MIGLAVARPAWPTTGKPLAGKIIATLLALLLAPATQRELPPQDRLEDRHPVRVGGLGTRYPVQ